MLAVATAMTAIVGGPVDPGDRKGRPERRLREGRTTKPVAAPRSAQRLTSRPPRTSVSHHGAAGEPSRKDAGNPEFEIEDLFGNLALVAGALAAAGVLILVAGLLERRADGNRPIEALEAGVDRLRARIVPAVPRVFTVGGDDFRRPPAGWSPGAGRGVQLRPGRHPHSAANRKRGIAGRQEPSRGRRVGCALEPVRPKSPGHGLAFLAGLLALKWLSRWLEAGRWYLFRHLLPCGGASVFVLHSRGIDAPEPPPSTNWPHLQE